MPTTQHSTQKPAHNPIAEMYQPYWDAYGQIAAETLLFTTKIGSIAMTATQRTLNASLQANQEASEAAQTAEAETRQPSPQSFFFPGIPPAAAGVQDQMMRNAAEWQKQMASYFQQYLRPAGQGTSR